MRRRATPPHNGYRQLLHKLEPITNRPPAIDAFRGSEVLDGADATVFLLELNEPGIENSLRIESFLGGEDGGPLVSVMRFPCRGVKIHPS